MPKPKSFTTPSITTQAIKTTKPTKSSAEQSLLLSARGFAAMSKTLTPLSCSTLLPKIFLFHSCKLHIMSWRYKWSLLHATQKTQILKTRSVRYISSSPVVCFSVTDKTQNLFSRESNFKVPLTPQIVYSTLLNCPSDLSSLSSFIWCAKQNNYFHDKLAFDHIVSAVSGLGERYMTVKAIVRELESVGFVVEAQTFLLLLRIYWRGGMYSMVFEVFEEMVSFGFTPSTFARNVLMDVLFKIGRVDVGIKVLKETQFPDFWSFNIALRDLCKLNDLVKVKNVIRMMLSAGYYPNVETCEMVLNCFCKAGRLKEAHQVLGLMITLGISLSVNAWSMLINGFCRLHQPVMAGCLLEKMVRSGCSPNVVTYTSLVKGFIESQMVTGAFGILNTMKSEGHAPDLVLYNVLINSLSKIGRYDDALDVFVDLLKSNLVPDSYTFSSLLSTIRVSQRFSLLPKLANGLVIEADLVVCNSLLSYFCKAGFPSCSVKLYNDMIDKGFTPDNRSFVGLLRGLCGAGRTDEAVNVYRGILMNYPGVDAHVHTVIVDGLIRSGECHKAIELFRRAIVEKYPLDVVSYTVAIRGLHKGGRAVEASALYSQMKEVGLSPNAYTYNIMLRVFCRIRDIKMIENLLQEIVEVGIQLDYNMFVILVNFLSRSYQSSSSIKQLIKIWKLGLVPDEATYVPSLSGPAHGVKVGDVKQSLLTGYLEDNLFVDSFSSDDYSDVAASVG